MTDPEDDFAAEFDMNRAHIAHQLLALYKRIDRLLGELDTAPAAARRAITQTIRCLCGQGDAMAQELTDQPTDLSLADIVDAQLRR